MPFASKGNNENSSRMTNSSLASSCDSNSNEKVSLSLAESLNFYV